MRLNGMKNDELLDYYKSWTKSFPKKTPVIKTFHAELSDLDHNIAVCMQCEKVVLSKIPDIQRFPCVIHMTCSCGLIYPISYGIDCGLHGVIQRRRGYI